MTGTTSIKADEIKFIAMDMDGTILDEGYRLSPRVSSTLNTLQGQGKRLIIATGRIYAASYGFLLGAFEPDAFVCTNGADIYGSKAVHIASHYIPEGALPALTASGRRHDALLCCYVGEEWVYEKPSPMVDFYEKRSGVKGLRRDFDTLAGEDILKFLAIGPHGELLEMREEITQGAPGLLETVFSHDNMLEIMVKGVSKRNGLEECLAHFGGTLAETVAFGDAENDLEMLKAVGVGVAMGNAHPAIQAEVEHLAPSVDEDGVARFLEELFEL